MPALFILTSSHANFFVTTSSLSAFTSPVTYNLCLLHLLCISNITSKECVGLGIKVQMLNVFLEIAKKELHTDDLLLNTIFGILLKDLRKKFEYCYYPC